MKNSQKNPDLTDLLEKLSPIERKIVPYLENDLETLKEKSKLDETSLLRALKFLESKEALKLNTKITKIVDIGTNGIYYKKNHLPERVLLTLLEKNNLLSIEEAKKLSKLSENEYKVSIGILKGKALISLNNGKLALTANKEEIIKKTLEEQLIEILPKKIDSLPPEMIHALENLKKRKDIIELKEEKEISFTLTDLGKSLINQKMDSNLIEEVTPEVIKSWNKNTKFRKYDIQSQVPKINGGKRHFVNQSIEYAKNIWLEMGFKEMTGKKTVTSFWNFDALFQPQDHPVRDMHDTFFIKSVEGKLPSKEIIANVKKAHEQGVDNSSGWKYSWKEDESKKVLLRTHTTCLSAQTLSKLNKKDLPAKFFAIGKVYRNETLDWSHGFDFNMTEGIVIDKNANFRHLLGYLKEFFKKMGFTDIRFTPAYFPYTEPSVEIHWWHKERKVWLELGGAGIFRPEVTIPLLRESIPVLAWGPGFDRIIMDYYKIKDLRKMYSNNIKDLRRKEMWIK
ncbi:hypothetical protein COU54_03665 [Candidatus Pacearchaeota archaeon CG10_big_fil_rev_8_21_14_0_10_31_24]|nr:MAG: hypothetical protein COU54_03665 [Candidatus Pacearchaeota archaeon CG10_big_fil_rev_8_21_14_0_10_31_24]